MPERDGYIAGVPCWVDTSQPDPDVDAGCYRCLTRKLAGLAGMGVRLTIDVSAAQGASAKAAA